MIRPDDFSTVYLDGSAILATVAKTPGHEPITHILDLISAQKLRLIASTLLFVEVRSSHTLSIAEQKAEDKLLSLFDHPHVLMVELDRFTARKARKIASEFSVKNSEAIHIASAIGAEADVIMSLNENMPIGKSIEGVWIDKPYPPGGPDLFSN